MNSQVGPASPGLLRLNGLRAPGAAGDAAKRSKSAGVELWRSGPTSTDLWTPPPRASVRVGSEVDEVTEKD